MVSSQTYFKCTDKCAYSNDYRVVKGEDTYCYYYSCPSEYTFVGGNDGYECKKTCDSQTYKVQNSRNLCVATCGKFYLEDAAIVSGQTYLKCADSCGSKIYRVNAANKMICAATCSGHYYQEDTDVVSGYTYFKCAAACAHPSTDYRVSKNGETYCYNEYCPNSYIFIETSSSKECKATCSAGIYREEDKKKVCATTCADHYYQESELYTDSWHTYFKCAAACASQSNYMVIKGSETYCYNYYCPDDRRFIPTSDSKVCQATCSSKIYKEDGRKNICVTSCTTTFYREDTSAVQGELYLKCASTCDNTDNVYKIENSKRICTATCANHYYR